MKKLILLSAAAMTLVSVPAFAAKIGDNGVGTYYISGTASNFCVLGQATAASTAGGNNVTVDTTTANPDGYSGGTSDALIKINTLQNGDDHAKAWRAVINLRHSVCNTAYTVTAQSENGGLQYQGTQAGSSSDFFKKLPYTVAATFDGHGGNAKTAASLANGGTLANSGRASAGDFRLVFDGNADNAKYLLSGDYTDRVVVTMAANAGGTTVE